MKMVQKLSLLAMVITLASCNEKVSPELQQGSATTPDSTTPVAPDEYYFNIENTSAALLNYKLHKTGAGNMSTKCEVRNTTGFSSDIFRGNPVANDITCYFDAEELSLYHAGFNFKVNASKNTCDFIGYSPYGYYNRMPGDSTASMIQTVCTNDTTTKAHVDLAAAAEGLDIRWANPGDPAVPIAPFTDKLGCDEFVTEGALFPAATRLKFSAESDAELCRFNYKNGDNEKCDIGTINVRTLAVTYTPADGATPALLKQTVLDRVIECGGAVSNCVRGPTRKIEKEAARAIEITEGEINKDFSKEYKYGGIAGTTASNIHYANYRKNLANPNIDFGASTGNTGVYKGKFNSAAFGKIFDPKLMDTYSSNVMLDYATPFITDPMLLAEATKTKQYFALPLAGEPYVGLEERINPFYTFYCLDTAYDVKARVRMVVRDWDRTFPSTDDLELLSDIFRGVNSRQDAPGYFELPEDLDEPIVFNDRNDWDDRFPLERTVGVLAPTSTIWKPVATLPASYPDGWFNRALFPAFTGGDQL